MLGSHWPWKRVRAAGTPHLLAQVPQGEVVAGEYTPPPINSAWILHPDNSFRVHTCHRNKTPL